jgi:RNA polymerase sigma factor (sigma-70 family)
MSHDDDFADLMSRAISEDPAAIRDFVARFEREVQMMVRARLPRRLRTQYDSVDFVQAVWKSFFLDLRDQPRDFDNAEHLRKFLAGVVRNKVQEQHRRLTRTEKYNVTREQSLYIRRGDREVLRDVISPEPSPSEEVQGRDRLEQLIAGRSPLEIEVVTLRRQGLTHDEIAARTGLNERSVRRIIESVRSQMEARS